MAKAYWVVCYRKVLDPAKVDAYRKLAGDAIESAGGRFIVRGSPATTYEAGLAERVVIVEFPSVAAATAAHDSPAYREALKALDGGAERDMRVVEGL